MNIEYKGNAIIMDKTLNSLDDFVIEFTTILNNLSINYVLISGYVAILFGRSRSSEDIDMFIEEIDYNKFFAMWKALYDKYECLATDNAKDAYEDYMKDGLALRFSYKGEFVPNMELKFPKMELDRWSINNRKEVLLNKKTIYISPIELQIPFKLKLGSDKDLEDAQHLYEVFKGKLDDTMFNGFLVRLNVIEAFEKELK